MQTLSTLAPNDAEIYDAPPAVHEPQPSLPLRSDTILGVCEAIGQDFGINPTYLRLAFAVLFYVNPVMVFATYLALGVGVALARWLYPVPTAASVRPAEPPPAPVAENEDSQASLAA